MHAPASPSPAVPPPAAARAEWRPLLALAGPLVGANLLQMAVYSVDVVFVARLGTAELAAATLGVFVFSLILWTLIGLATACAPLIAAELGARRHAVREVRRSFRMAMWLAVVTAVPAMALLANGAALLRLAGQDPQVAARAGAFMAVLLVALLPAIAAAVMRTVAAALGRPGWALGVTALALGVGLLGNWLLVFGHAGFPALGLEGSAIASVVTSVVTMIAYAAILRFDRRLRRYRLFGRWWRPEWPRLRQIVALGLPIALTLTLEAGLFGGAAILMGLIGVTEVAAHAIALNIAAIAFQVPLGMAQAATIRVGLAYGARDRRWIARAGSTAILIGTGFMTLTAVSIWTMPRLFIGIYLDVDAPANARVVALAVRYLAVAAMFQLFDGAQAVTAGALRGLQDTRWPMLIAAFGYWVIGFGTAVLLGFRAGWQGVGIWAGLAAGLAAVSMMLVWRWAARERLGLLAAPVD
ncbi:MATE family efflux transporter [Sphingomonas sp. CROZ-RG-20F-R02-07]|uniref:MATE family efflux transporter n=1 Tax=Sphingomonas sp. CROZ-RG-20F-R02-07 TaxID=2914832 RepID=UPI001F591865|nr:MATE family efflux transporter [Sphingomonas sp. CROZ-RG-20F-R02-07]